MAKRVDFSLGMKDVSSGDLIGDIYDNKGPNHSVNLRRRSLSRSMDTRDRIVEEDEENLQTHADGHSASQSQGPNSRYGLHRSSTESGSRVRRSLSAIHRNRFFPRHARRASKGEYEDLMEQGIADVPESVGASGIIDPRSGTVSPLAVRMTTESELAHQVNPDAGAVPQVGPSKFQARAPVRSRTEDFEMRDMNR